MNWTCRGYCKGSDKGAAKKFKDVPDSELDTLEQVKNCDSYGEILKKDVVLIDIDDKEQADLLYKIVTDEKINCRVYQTDRGKHFLFKHTNQSIRLQCHNKKTAIGITVDAKPGHRNTYHCLKKNGKERILVLDTDSPDELPIWLSIVKDCPDLVSMGDGDGRDSTLYSYVLTLTRAGFTKDNTRETIRIINRYILKDRLSERDIERITRDEAFPKETFFEGNTFKHDRFSRWFAAEHNVAWVDGTLSIYHDGVFSTNHDIFERYMYTHLPILKSAQRNEVLNTLEIMPLPELNKSSAALIPFANGVLNIETMELIDYRKDHVFVHKIPWDWNPDAQSPAVDKMLDNVSCHDPEIRALLEECMGYCFYTRNKLSKAFLLSGSGSNGKSTYLEMIQWVLGEGNYSSLDIKNFGEKFSIGEIQGKMANIADDISAEMLDGFEASLFKKIVTGESIKAEFKGEKPFKFKPTCKLILSMNGDLRFRQSTSEAIIRRLITIPFKAQFKPTDPDYDPFLEDKLHTQAGAERMVYLGVMGLKRALTKGFTNSETAQTELKNLQRVNDSFASWLDDGHWERENFINRTPDEIYVGYEAYCQEEGITSPLKKRGFGLKLCQKFNLESKVKTIKGKSRRVYMENNG